MIYSGSPEEIVQSFSERVGGSQVMSVILGNRSPGNISDPSTIVKPSAGAILRAVGGGAALQQLLENGTVAPEDMRIILSGGATNKNFPGVTEAQVMKVLLQETHPQLMDGSIPLSETGTEVKSMTHAREALQTSLLKFSGIFAVFTEAYYLHRAVHQIERMGINGDRVHGIPVNPFFAQVLPQMLPGETGKFHQHDYQELASRVIRPPLPEYLLEIIVGRALNYLNGPHDWVSKMYGNYLRFL